MSYISRDKRNTLPIKQNSLLASSTSMLDQKPENVLFYEFEPAIVVDVILDETHPAISKKTVWPMDVPKNLDGTDPKLTDLDYSWIGRVKVRMLITDNGVTNESLRWAMPLESTGVVEVPLINELVSTIWYKDQLYYTKKINLGGFVNANASFTMEPYYGLNESVREYGTTSEFVGPTSTINVSETGTGKLGKSFIFNPRIRSLRKYEGDTIIESRFGSSIRFGAYESNGSINKSNSKYTDYPVGTGNPHVLIRNRQADASESEISNFPNGYVTESINYDGSSIHLTSGNTVSDFVTSCKKVMFQSGVSEEQSNFSPNKLSTTTYKFPSKLDRDQIVINSDRIVAQARGSEFFQFSKKRFGIVTDDEFTVDAHKQIVLTTNSKTVINSPKIYLGEAVEGEPVLLGRTTVLWMSTLCDWILLNTNTQISAIQSVMSHFHLAKGSPTSPPMPPALVQLGLQLVSLQAQQLSLLGLQMQLDALMSKRVFVTGGGGEPGSDGGNLKQ